MGNISNKTSGEVMGPDTTEKAGTFRIGFWTGSMQHLSNKLNVTVTYPITSASHRIPARFWLPQPHPRKSRACLATTASQMGSQISWTVRVHRGRGVPWEFSLIFLQFTHFQNYPRCDRDIYFWQTSKILIPCASELPWPCSFKNETDLLLQSTHVWLTSGWFLSWCWLVTKEAAGHQEQHSGETGLAFVHLGELMCLSG